MKPKIRSLNILSFILVVVSLGYGIFSPVLPFYIESMGANGTTLGLLNASYAVMRLIFGPVWGSISDRVGRKRVLMAGILGFGLTMAWFGLADRLWMLFAARILAGILSSATAPTTMAYISDNAPGEELNKGIGRLSAAGGIGGILGPLLGGLVAGNSLSTPFFIAAGLAALSLVLAAFFLPESKAADPNRSNEENMINLKDWKRAITGPAWKYFMLTFITTSGLYIFSNVFGLYGLERFGYGTGEVGVVYMALSLVSMLSAGFLVGPTTKRLGEMKIIRYGFLVGAVCLGILPLVAGLPAIVLLASIMGAAVSMESTSLVSMTSKEVRVEQGIAMGLSNSFISLGRIVGPVIGGFLLDINLGLPFFCSAGMLILGLLLSLRGSRKLEGDLAGSQDVN